MSGNPIPELSRDRQVDHFLRLKRFRTLKDNIAAVVILSRNANHEFLDFSLKRMSQQAAAAFRPQTTGDYGPPVLTLAVSPEPVSRGFLYLYKNLFFSDSANTGTGVDARECPTGSAKMREYS